MANFRGGPLLLVNVESWTGLSTNPVFLGSLLTWAFWGNRRCCCMQIFPGYFRGDSKNHEGGSFPSPPDPLPHFSHQSSRAATNWPDKWNSSFLRGPTLPCGEEFALKFSPCPALSTHLALCECDKWKPNSPRSRKQALSPARHSKTFAVFITKLSGLHWAAKFKAAEMLSSQMLLSSFWLIFWCKNTSKLMEVGWSELAISNIHVRHSVRNNVTWHS